MAVQRAARGVGNLLALAAVVHVGAVARADPHRPHRDAVTGQQMPEDVAGAVLDGGGQDGQRDKEDDGVGRVRNIRFVTLRDAV
ncbi:MAG: hypothetical protein ACXWYP_06755, partial [Pseudonocardia sp.]